MPYSFTQIEQDKSKTIALVFSFLILIYFLALGGIFFIVKNYVFLTSWEVYNRSLSALTFQEMGIVFDDTRIEFSNFSLNPVLPITTAFLK